MAETLITSNAKRLFKRAVNRDDFREVAQMLGIGVRQLRYEAMHRPNRLNKRVSQLSNDAYHKIYDNPRFIKYDKKEHSVLRSSWIQSGVYRVNSRKSLGTLTLTLKKGKKRVYTWYQVPSKCWRAMQKSKNHAGTAFWHYYLHKYHKANGMKKLGVLFEMLGINGYKKGWN